METLSANEEGVAHEHNAADCDESASSQVQPLLDQFLAPKSENSGESPGSVYSGAMAVSLYSCRNLILLREFHLIQAFRSNVDSTRATIVRRVTRDLDVAGASLYDVIGECKWMRKFQGSRSIIFLALCVLLV